MANISEHFPTDFQPRPIQNEILKYIQSQIDSGFKTIILSAPTGVGKSLIAATLARYFGSSFIVTASKHLQDQYIKDLQFLKPVKGKSNFPCLKLMEHEKVKSEQVALQKGLTCEKGVCQETKEKKGKKVIEICKFKPKIEECVNDHSDDGYCHYYKQKYLALNSDHSLWNYSSYFQLMKFSRDVFADYIDRPVAIFDEAHKIEDQIIQFVGIDIYDGNLRECGIDVKSYALDNIDLVAQLTEDLALSYAKQLKEIKKSRSFLRNPDYRIIAKLEGKYDRMINASIEIKSNKDNFIIDEPKKDDRGNFKSLSIKPLDISKYVGSLFDIPTRIFMSATIDKDSFCENTGIALSEVAFVDTPKSPFLLENRRVNFLDVRKLSQKSSEDDELTVIRKIDEILTKHSKQRGLILTSSESRCHRIRNNLSPQNMKRIRICHSMNPNGKTQDQILQEHYKDETGVLLSSSLWEGVDLKDDLSRFQIIAKTPYPGLGEKRVKIKMEKYPLWYKSQTIMKLLQGLGRSIRSEKDWAITYVLDSAALELLNRSKSMIPKAYYDILGWKTN
ncbi:MAG: helicase C-terminal domain-containing protein [Nitrosopumilaceae archaeon]